MIQAGSTPVSATLEDNLRDAHNAADRIENIFVGIRAVLHDSHDDRAEHPRASGLMESSRILTLRLMDIADELQHVSAALASDKVTALPGSVAANAFQRNARFDTQTGG